MAESNDSDIQEILKRSGIEAKGDITVKPLDKFESKVVDIALRLVNDENGEYDPQTAGMDILDVINDKQMMESWERRAGTWYDPYKRALEILQEELDEDAFQDMRDRMAAQADTYLKQRDSSLAGATTDAGASEQPEPKERVSLFGTAADQLEEIARLAIRDNYQIGREGIAKLREIIATLQAQDEKVVQQQQGMFRRKGKGRNKGNRRKWGIFSGVGEADEVDEIRRLAGITESEFDARRVVPELRGIAINFVTDPNAKQRIMEIAEELSQLT